MLVMGNLKEKLKLLPENPGEYVMLDKDGIVIYVGKARVLKNRVRQYFHSSVKSEKVAAMVENIADFYYIITQTEIDALALENNLIKKFIGLNIMDTATYLFLAAKGYVFGRIAPILTNGVVDAEYYINPSPAGLVLTGIVVSVSVTAFSLALVLRLYKHYGTLNMDEILRMVREEEGE